MNTNEQVEHLIRTLENSRYEAVLAGDFQAFAELMHPELSYAHSTSGVDTLASYVEKCNAGFFIYHRLEHPIDSITVVGDTAVVRGEMSGDVTVGGVRKQLHNQVLAVWVNGPQGWKMLAFQPMPVVRHSQPH